MRSSLVASLILLLAIATSVVAQPIPAWMPSDSRWMPIRFEDNSFPLVFMDTSKVVVSDEGLVKVWIFMGWEAVSQTTAGPWDNGRLLREYDCDGRRYRPLSIHGYVGTRFSFSDEATGTWVEIAPESADETLLEAACKRSRLPWGGAR
jgi:hypothetical protein